MAGGRRRSGLVEHTGLGLLLLGLCLAATPVFSWWNAPWPDPWRNARVERAVLEPFVDGLMGAQIAAYQIPGAAVAIVQHDEILLAKGYGLARVGSATPVRADRTLFRVGSVAKVLTWMALLQLAESGGLSLEQDVNEHLGELALPSTFQAPVTPSHLITHSAGFEDRFAGLFAASGGSLLTLPDYLQQYRPVRVRPPGQITAYSNYGAALAGHLLERVTGVRFEDYVARHIFQPLDMLSSTFAQPVPESLRAHLATGYGKRLEPLGFEWLQAAPSGALSTTATDMARLMLTILGGGQLGEARVLKDGTVETMLTRQFTNDRRLPGLTFAFQEYLLNGQRLLWHPGDTLGFSSALVLVPVHRLGIFVVYNRLADSQPRADFLKVFMERFFPALPTPPPIPTGAAAGRGVRYAGSYLPSRSNLSGPEKVFKLFRPVTVDALPDGRLQTHGLWAVKEGLWLEIEPGAYRHTAGEGILQFRVQQDRVIMLEGNYPQGAYLRVPWYGAHRLHGFTWITAAVGFFVTLAAAAVRLTFVRAATPSASLRWPQRLVEAMSLVQLGVLLGLLSILVNLRAFAAYTDRLLDAVGLLALLGAVFAAAAVVSQGALWRPAAARWGSRIWYGMVALLGLLFSLSLAYWRVLPVV